MQIGFGPGSTCLDLTNHCASVFAPTLARRSASRTDCPKRSTSTASGARSPIRTLTARPVLVCTRKSDSGRECLEVDNLSSRRTQGSKVCPAEQWWRIAPG